MKTFLVILLAIAAAVVAWYFFARDGRMTNGEMLTAGQGLAIITSDEAYTEGANGYFARPETAGSYPGVIMIHENRGIRPETRLMADELARRGYNVLAVDLLGASVETQEEARALTAKYDQARGIENMRAAASFLRAHGSPKLASLGWCFGGAQSLQLSLSGEPLDATVIYYGRLVTDEQQLAKLKWPVLGIFGDRDTSIPATAAMAFEATLDRLDVPNEIHIYPGVGHAFANPSGMNYAPEATKDAWAKTVRFLDENLLP